MSAQLDSSPSVRVASPRLLGLLGLTLWSMVTLLCGCSDTVVPGPLGEDVRIAEPDGGVSKGCLPGLAGCVNGDRVVCNAAGDAFQLTPCASAQHCADGKCVGCLSNADCEPGRRCTDQACVSIQLRITTEALATAQAGQPYTQPLAAAGGAPPYSWRLEQGTLPQGLAVSPNGEVQGSATTAGVASISIAVTDADGKTASRIFTLEVKASDALLITTPSPLKGGQTGKSYSLQLVAKGGQKPYFWGLKSGSLVKGLSLGADGKLAGVPQQDGQFSFEIKVLDDGSPTLSATRNFQLSVGLAPLKIVGSKEVNLFVTKVIVLPLIVVVKGVAIPYNTTLQAKGGKKPYTWSEIPLPNAVKSFVPNSGLPKGLSLNKNGQLSGSVSDPKLVVEVKIPLTKIVLKGFFFAAKVRDAQGKPKSKSAIFIIPTAPVKL